MVLVYHARTICVEDTLKVSGERVMARLREYVNQKLDNGKGVRTVPIGNSLAPWRVWIEDGEGWQRSWTGLQGVDRPLNKFEQFNQRLQAEIGRKALGLVRSWRRF